MCEQDRDEMSRLNGILDVAYEEVTELHLHVHTLREAIRLTREYVGESTLPALPGWSWYDAIEVTGGFDGFGNCGMVLDPQVHGLTKDGDLGLLYCTLDINHDGDHGRAPEPAEDRSDWVTQ